MSPMLVHTVDAADVDLDLAIALGIEVTAVCGKRWVPTLSGDELAGLDECPTCKPMTVRRHLTGVEDQRPHYVYRYYDSAGALLYIGCTVNPRARDKQHRASSSWYSEVASVRRIVFPNRWYARQREREAIQAEHPAHNVRMRAVQ